MNEYDTLTKHRVFLRRIFVTIYNIFHWVVLPLSLVMYGELTNKPNFVALGLLLLITAIAYQQSRMTELLGKRKERQPVEEEDEK